MKHFIYILFIFTGSIQAQYTVEGNVTSNIGAIATVSVYIENTNNGAVTDIYGGYIITSEQDKFHLIFSALGYQTQRIFIDFNQENYSKKLLNVYLVEQIESLDAITIIDQQSGLTRQTPYAVTAIDMKTMQSRFNPGGLAASITELPGISGATLGTGIVKPFIRGLGFSRVVTIFQNNKLENHQWGQDHGLGLNNLGVSRVDVVKGPASILYGSGAIGGVLLVKDDEFYLSSKKLSGNFGSSFNSNSLGNRNFLSLGQSFKNNLFFAIDAAIENHADYKDGDNRIIGNSRFNNQNIRVHTGIDKEQFKNKLSFTYLNQNLGIIEDDELNETMATTRNDRQMQLPFQKVTDYLVSYSQETFHDKFQTFLHTSYHYNDRSEIEEDFNEVDLGINQHHTFISGRISLTQKNNFKHSFGFQSGFLKTLNKNDAQEILIPDANTFDIGAYYLGSKKLDKIFLQAGLRFDYRKTTAFADRDLLVDYGFVLPGNPPNQQLSTEFNGFTGSLGATFTLNNVSNLKVNVSTGFRAPDLAELFSNGPHPGTNRYEVGNENFEREQSLQTDLSYALKLEKLEFGASIYYNSISNYIFFTNTGNIRPEDGLQIWEFQQQNANLYGTEWQLKYIFNEQFNANATAALVRGTTNNFKDNLTFIPTDNYSLALNYLPSFIKELQLETNVSHFSAQNRPGFNEIATPAYTLFNLGMTKNFDFGNDKLTVSIRANNLLNETYVDHLSILRAFEIPNPGRTFLVMLTYKF